MFESLLALDFSNMDFSWLYNPFFKICTMVYFALFGLNAIRYAFKSRNHPKKRNHPEYFYNELLIGFLFFVLVALYPFLFDKIVVNTENPEYIKAQMYFHLWDSLTVNFFVWMICIPIWKWNNRRKGREMTYEEWAEHFKEDYAKRDPFIADLKRKMMHLIPVGVIVGFYSLSNYLFSHATETYGWDSLSFAMYFIAAVGIHFLLIMNIADNLRLQRFHTLGKFARDWAEDAMKPNELYTFTSANTMILSWVPFVMFEPVPQLLFTVALIGALADAMASTVGKKFGKIRPKNMEKTVEGFIAGSVTAFLMVYFVNWMFPFPNVTPTILFAMALGAGFGFLLVDVFGRVLSDNFLNPLVTGTIIWVIYHVLV